MKSQPHRIHSQNQARWLAPNKPEEELYDLQNDPYELNNLALQPELRDTLMHLRRVLDKWIVETNDLGRIPENELIAKWLPNGKQPKLPPLEMQESNDKISLYSSKTDATVLWKQPQDSLWNIYIEPLPNSISFEAKAS